MKKITLTFYSDPGHAWLKAPRSYLNTLGIAGEITEYSYQKGEYVYLEEDLDASTFLNAARSCGWEVKIKESNARERLSLIRNYARYRAM
jgi:hypothetical protein